MLNLSLMLNFTCKIFIQINGHIQRSRGLDLAYLQMPTEPTLYLAGVGPYKQVHAQPLLLRVEDAPSFSLPQHPNNGGQPLTPETCPEPPDLFSRLRAPTAMPAAPAAPRSSWQVCLLNPGSEPPLHRIFSLKAQKYTAAETRPRRSRGVGTVGQSLQQEGEAQGSPVSRARAAAGSIVGEPDQGPQARLSPEGFISG